MHEADTLQAVLRTDLAALTEKCLSEIAPSANFVIAWHHLAIIHQLNRAAQRQVRRLIINQPPRTAKTQLVSVSFVVYLLLQDPTLKIAILGYDQPLASRSVRAIRDILQSDWFKALAPATRIRSDKNTETYFQTTEGGEVRAFSLEGGITGHGFDFIIMDDPMKAIDAYSEAARRAVEEKYRAEIANRWLKPNEGVLILVMQRLHADDFTAFLRRVHPDAEHLVIPAIAPTDLAYRISDDQTHLFAKGALIEPHRLSLAVLDEMRRVQGSANFEAQYQQAPLASGGPHSSPHFHSPVLRERLRVYGSGFDFELV